MQKAVDKQNNPEQVMCITVLLATPLVCAWFAEGFDSSAGTEQDNTEAVSFDIGFEVQRGPKRPL